MNNEGAGGHYPSGGGQTWHHTFGQFIFDLPVSQWLELRAAHVAYLCGYNKGLPPNFTSYICGGSDGPLFLYTSPQSSKIEVFVQY